MTVTKHGLIVGEQSPVYTLGPIDHSNAICLQWRGGDGWQYWCGGSNYRRMDLPAGGVSARKADVVEAKRRAANAVAKEFAGRAKVFEEKQKEQAGWRDKARLVAVRMAVRKEMEKA